MNKDAANTYMYLQLENRHGGSQMTHADQQKSKQPLDLLKLSDKPLHKQ